MRVYHTIVMATKPATAVAWQTTPTAVGTVGTVPRRGRRAAPRPVPWHRSAPRLPCDRSRTGVSRPRSRMWGTLPMRHAPLIRPTLSLMVTCTN